MSDACPYCGLKLDSPGAAECPCQSPLRSASIKPILQGNILKDSSVEIDIQGGPGTARLKDNVIKDSQINVTQSGGSTSPESALSSGMNASLIGNVIHESELNITNITQHFHGKSREASDFERMIVEVYRAKGLSGLVEEKGRLCEQVLNLILY